MKSNKRKSSMKVTPVFDDIDLELIAESLRCCQFTLEDFNTKSKLCVSDRLRLGEVANLLERVEELLHSDETTLVER